MLEILPSPDNVAAYKLSGVVDGDDYDRLIADLEARLKRREKWGVLADLSEFRDITLQAAGKDFRYGLSKLLQLNRFPREAVITDKEWIRTLARVASPLIPFVEIRSFAPAEAAAAMDWVAGVP
ncbi:SpoIIAA-like [Sphingomonas laterariae]|uniref:SpoIIAA-like n=1 Tax=Edaphosphingomonas laterariae TaxID=861865 RepID=A0A239L1H5_9SPHN|nr:STAS/SEC14 domain-containing protein [Sphingomonas laterariae]SNT24150.1 SpoIIAA-like [Sphingomonas laterariae]